MGNDQWTIVAVFINEDGNRYAIQYLFVQETIGMDSLLEEFKAKFSKSIGRSFDGEIISLQKMDTHMVSLD